ncbi:hypothetical protein KIL84_014044 [Mauremys mutica]|uniref:Uncharacterized protein n=1 Tax=Mauremys mutica TaxID=74926 RepID=A0A9D4AT30_9SAUR|nr:hypothetical protein KIL84_014044 [Mauremys mutica]
MMLSSLWNFSEMTKVTLTRVSEICTKSSWNTFKSSGICDGAEDTTSSGDDEEMSQNADVFVPQDPVPLDILKGTKLLLELLLWCSERSFSVLSFNALGVGVGFNIKAEVSFGPSANTHADINASVGIRSFFGTNFFMVVLGVIPLLDGALDDASLYIRRISELISSESDESFMDCPRTWSFSLTS